MEAWGSYSTFLYRKWRGGSCTICTFSTKRKWHAPQSSKSKARTSVETRLLVCFWVSWDRVSSLISPVFLNSELGKDLVEKEARQDDGDDIRPPLPVKRDVLYEDPMLYRYTTFFLVNDTDRNPIYTTLSLICTRNLVTLFLLGVVWLLSLSLYLSFLFSFFLSFDLAVNLMFLESSPL